MKKEDMIRELYEHKIMNTIRARYRETVDEKNKVQRRSLEIANILSSDERRHNMTHGEYLKLTKEANECDKRHDELKIILSVWYEAREICMDCVSEVLKEE